MILKQQTLDALYLIRDLSQERINTMGSGLQSIVVPASQTAFNILGQLIEDHFKPTPEPTPPP